MAKTFGGFTPQQQQTLLSKMGYTGPAQQDDMNKFMMSSPKAASMMGKYAEMAKARVEGGPQMAMNVGGYASAEEYKAAMQKQYGTDSPSYLDNVTGGAYSTNLAGFNTKPTVDNTTRPVETGDTTVRTPDMQMPTIDPRTGKPPEFVGGPALPPGFVDTKPIVQPVEPQPPSSQKGDSILKTPQGNFTYTGRTTTQADGTTRMVFTIKDSTGRTVANDLTSGDFYKWTQDNQATAEKIYDPSQGLPTAVDTPDYTELAKGAMEGVIANDSGWAAEKTAELIENEAIRSNPNDYTLRKDGNYYTIVYGDGTEVKTGYRGKGQAEGRAQAIVKGVTAAAPSYDETKTAQDTYNQQLEQYKQYQAGQAQEAAEAPVFETIDAAQGAVTTSQNIIANYNTELAGLDVDDPRRSVIEELIGEEQVKLNQAKAGLKQAQDRAAQERSQARMQATSEFEADPGGKVKRADVATMSQAQKEAGMIAEGVGQAGETTDAMLTTAKASEGVAEPVAKEAAKVDAIKITPQVEATVDKLVAATGEPSEGALAKGAEMTPQELASLGLTVDQIEEATQVIAPERRTIQEGELIEGPTVDMGRLEEEALNFEAATGTPSSDATVAGQLTKLQEQFEDGNVPSWAAGAIRAANATMAARGLGASSMAGQAVLQAAMESAMPIAMADAQTVAQFEAQNLSNRQQTAMMKAEQRAKFLGMEFDQRFQTRVQNAARIADVANQNFTAEQQIALENARLAQTVNIANLDARNAKIMADAAAMSQVDITNLNNRQQAAIQYANSFLQMDMANLTNEQQAAMFKSQSIVQSLLSDQAAENAAEQFNATSENQTNQFYDSLTSQVQQFNVDQSNAMERFNAGEANALAQFNKQQADRRAEFNAQQSLVVEQANAKWMQDIALTETAAINEANRDAAKAENEMTMAAYEAQMQAERDAMSYSFQTANNNADRATQIAIETMRQEASADADAASKSAAMATAIGAVVANIV